MSVTYIYKCDGCGKKLVPNKPKEYSATGRRSRRVDITFGRSSGTRFSGEFCLTCIPPIAEHVDALIAALHLS